MNIEELNIVKPAWTEIHEFVHLDNFRWIEG